MSPLTASGAVGAARLRVPSHVAALRQKASEKEKLRGKLSVSLAPSLSEHHDTDRGQLLERLRQAGLQPCTCRSVFNARRCTHPHHRVAVGRVWKVVEPDVTDHRAMRGGRRHRALVKLKKVCPLVREGTATDRIGNRDRLNVLFGLMDIPQCAQAGDATMSLDHVSPDRQRGSGSPALLALQSPQTQVSPDATAAMSLDAASSGEGHAHSPMPVPGQAC